MAGESPLTLGLDGSEEFHMAGISRLEPGGTLEVAANHANGRRILFSVQVRLDTLSEARCFRSGGLLPQVLDQIMSGKEKPAPSV